jgi:hypothetical protein
MFTGKSLACLLNGEQFTNHPPPVEGPAAHFALFLSREL